MNTFHKAKGDCTLFTESTFKAVVENGSSLLQAIPLSGSYLSFSHEMDKENTSSPTKLVQCRICHDEDEDSNMEAPCSCCGSLKYAHRKCVQRWCNEKGDTNCEICQQPFKPGYTAPPPLFHYGGSPLNFRGNWEISRRHLQNHPFITLAATDHEFSDSDFEYSPPSMTGLICCRIIAIIFMVLLLSRHTLSIILSQAEEYSFTVYALLVLRTIGILVPVCIMAKVFIVIQRRRYQDYFSSVPSDEENDLGQPQSRVIHIL